MIKRKQDMRIEYRDRIRGGEGTLTCLNLLEKSECFGKMNYTALMHLEPGQSIGVHPHSPEAEMYYLLKGRLTAVDNGVETYLEEGDVMLTGNGETHSVRNDSGHPAVLLAVVIP